MVHVVLLETAKKPALHTQSFALSLESGEIESGTHCWHTSEIAPMAVENLPAAHDVQSVSPVATLYLPATHWAQAVPSGPVDPALQVHFDTLWLAAGELERNGQFWQTLDVAAIVGEYWPGAHSVH